MNWNSAWLNQVSMNNMWEWTERMTSTTPDGATALSWTLLHFVWQGAVVALVLALLLRFARKATTHYGLSLAAMIVLAIAPVATYFAVHDSAATSQIATSHAATSQIAAEPEPATSRLELDSLSDSDRKTLFAALLANGEEGYRDASATSLSLTTSAQSPFALWVVIGWLTGVGLFGLRLLFDFGQVVYYRRGRVALSPELIARHQRLFRKLGFSGESTVWLSQRVHDAVAVGFWRPCVLLPASWVTRLSPDMLEAVIAHELAHIRRFDLWVRLFQRLVEVALFYHPAVWLVSRKLRDASELCCDEWAIARTGRRVTYVETLHFLAAARWGGESMLPSRPALIATMGDRPMKLFNRINYLLSDAKARPRRMWRSAATLCVVAIGMVIAAAGMAAPQQSGDDGPPNPAVNDDGPITDEAIATRQDNDSAQDAADEITQELEAALRQLERELARELPALEEELAKALKELQTEFDEEELQKLQQELSSELEEALQELEKELAEVLPELEKELAEVLPELEQELAEVLPELEKELAEAMKELGTELSGLDEEIAGELQGALKELEVELNDELAAELKDLEVELVEELKELELELGDLEGEELEQAMKELEQELEQVLPEIEKEIEAAMQELEKELSGVGNELERELQKAMEELERELEKAGSEIDREIESMLRELERELGGSDGDIAATMAAFGLDVNALGQNFALEVSDQLNSELTAALASLGLQVEDVNAQDIEVQVQSDDWDTEIAVHQDNAAQNAVSQRIEEQLRRALQEADAGISDGMQEEIKRVMEEAVRQSAGARLSEEQIRRLQEQAAAQRPNMEQIKKLIEMARRNAGGEGRDLAAIKALVEQAQRVRPDEATIKALIERAQAVRPDEETIRALIEQTREQAQRVRPDEATIKALIERAQVVRPDEETIRALIEQTREQAQQVRPDEATIKALIERAREQAQAVRPDEATIKALIERAREQRPDNAAIKALIEQARQVRPDNEAIKALIESAREQADQALPDKAAIKALLEQARQGRPDVEQIKAMIENARQQADQVRPDNAAIKALIEQARQGRPDVEQIKVLIEKLRQQAGQVRPNETTVKQLIERARQAAKESRPDVEQIKRMLEELRRRGDGGLELAVDSTVKVSLGGLSIPQVEIDNPDLIDVKSLSASEVLLIGKRPGNAQVKIWDENDEVHTFDISIGAGDSESDVDRAKQMLDRVQPAAFNSDRPFWDGMFAWLGGVMAG